MAGFAQLAADDNGSVSERLQPTNEACISAGFGRLQRLMGLVFDEGGRAQ